MNIVTEQDIIDIVKRKFNLVCKVKVTKPLIGKSGLSVKQFEELLTKINDEYNMNIDPLKLEEDSSISILKLVEIINEKKGINKCTIRDMFLEICKGHMDQNAIKFDDYCITYKQLKEQVEILSANFMKSDVKRGTKVAIILSNSLDYIYIYFALFYIGALPIPINTRWEKNEVYNVLDDSECKFIICEEKIGKIQFGEIISEYISKKCSITKIFYFGNNLFGTYGIEFKSMLMNRNNSLQCEAIESASPAMISYTSGTTGKPKGVILKHNDIVKISVYTNATWFGHDEEYPFSIAPLYSAQGFLSMFINLAFERCFKMISSFNPNDILKEISKRENTIIHTQPTMWTLLLNCRIIDFTRFDSIDKLIVSGSICSPELAKRIEKRIGCTLMNAYGLIEGTSVVTMTRTDDAENIRYNTVGRPIPGIEIKIVDSNRKEVSHGEVGELAIRGYNMLGYYKNEEQTARIIDKDGWLYTGDLAKYYDDENISIAGRCKDMIIRGGFNIYPSDIEEYILQMKEVQTAAVVGKPHSILGEEIVAFIVVKAGMILNKDDVIRYLFGRIANYKMPDKVYFISEMPIILAGKIDKKVLNNWVINGIPQDKQILFS